MRMQQLPPPMLRAVVPRILRFALAAIARVGHLGPVPDRAQAGERRAERQRMRVRVHALRNARQGVFLAEPEPALQVRRVGRVVRPLVPPVPEARLVVRDEAELAHEVRRACVFHPFIRRVPCPDAVFRR